MPGLPPDFWQRERVNLAAVLRPRLTALALAGAGEALAGLEPLGLFVDDDLINQDAVEWARRHTDFVLDQLGTTSERITGGLISNWIETPGATMADLTNSLLPVLDDNRARAWRVAVTETTRAFGEGNNLAHQRAGIPAALIVPPSHVNCVLPGNKIVIPDLAGATKAFYDGRCIEIIVSSGSKITVTPNHPVLTARGWIRAQFISESDQIITAANAERIALGINPYYDYRPTRIEEVFSSLAKSSFVLSERMKMTAEDFHGDARLTDGNVDVVFPNSLLENHVEIITKPPSEDALSGAGVRGGFFAGDCVLDIGSLRSFLPFSRGMAGGDLGGSFVGGHLRPLEGFGGVLVSEIDAVLQKTIGQYFSTNSGSVGQFLNRFASDIASDQVVKVRNFNYSGHVYDLQSANYGLYICNNIILHNCRCSLSVKRVKGEWVQVWKTNNDELVCVRPITTPWGSIAGCKGMHNRIVSSGPYAGKLVSEV